MIEELRALAQSQNGVILTRDVTAMGFDRNGARAVLRHLFRIGHGVYSVERPRNPQHLHFLRTIAALRVHLGAIASHVSAAVVHRLPLHRPDLSVVHLSCTGPGHGGIRAGTQIHRLARATPVQVDGVPVTPVDQTLIDCARTQSRDTAVVMADYALHMRRVTAEQLQEALSLSGQAWGISRARTVVALADGRAESVGETRARLICVDAGVAVTPQVEVRDHLGHLLARIDLGVDGLPLGIEFDGQGKYRDYLDTDDSPEQKYWEEKVRKELVEDHGRILVPVYWKMLDAPKLMLARVHRGMERAHRLAS